MKRFVTQVLRFLGLIQKQSPKKQLTTLLTAGNPKIAKGEKLGYLSFILHLAPSRMSGYQTCPMATQGCAAACLNTAGRGGMFAGEKTAQLSGSEMVEAIKSGALKNKIQAARVRRTKMFFESRDKFLARLVREIRSATILAELHELIPVIRLNGTSDIRWELYPVTMSGVRFANIFAAFPHIQFYDYTKQINRRVNHIPNYHLTFSLAESNEQHAVTAMTNGLNVAVVFRKVLPQSYLGRPVVNGDVSDLRFLDPKNVIVGLKAKGKAKKDFTSGFVKEAA